MKKYVVDRSMKLDSEPITNLLKEYLLSYLTIMADSVKYTENGTLLMEISFENALRDLISGDSTRDEESWIDLGEICMQWILENEGSFYSEKIQKDLENPVFVSYGIGHIFNHIREITTFVPIDYTLRELLRYGKNKFKEYERANNHSYIVYRYIASMIERFFNEYKKYTEYMMMDDEWISSVSDLFGNNIVFPIDRKSFVKSGYSIGFVDENIIAYICQLSDTIPEFISPKGIADNQIRKYSFQMYEKILTNEPWKILIISEFISENDDIIEALTPFAVKSLSDGFDALAVRINENIVLSDISKKIISFIVTEAKNYLNDRYVEEKR